MQNLGETFVVQASHPILWDSRYDQIPPKPHALYTKAVTEQWLADALDWDSIVDPAREMLAPLRNILIDPAILEPLNHAQREHFTSIAVADLLSQVLHGEQAGLMVACSLAQSLPDRVGKQLAATQAMDEARHLEVFSRYLQRLGGVSEPVDSLRRILRKILGAPCWQAQLVGLHVMVESLALVTFSSLRETTGCTLLRNMLRLIMRDEARHVAFGNDYLKSGLAQMHPDDRAVVEDFAVDLVRDFRCWGHSTEDMSSLFRMLIEVGVDPIDYLVRIKTRNNDRKESSLTPGMIYGLDALILPGLERAGLITDRVRPLYQASELEKARDLQALEKIERELAR